MTLSRTERKQQEITTKSGEARKLKKRLTYSTVVAATTKLHVLEREESWTENHEKTIEVEENQAENV
jgi:hypothetical protein